VSFVDRLERERQLRTQYKKERAEVRIKKLKASLERKKLTPISTEGLRWDTKWSKWVPDTVSTQENDNMSRLTLTPYDKNDQPIPRGFTSVNEDASPDEIKQKVRHAFVRAGIGRTVKVVATKKGGGSVQTYTPSDVALAITAAAPQSTEPATATEEDEVSKRKKTAAKKGNGEARRTRATVTLEMLGRKTGTTAEELVEAFKREFGEGKLTTAHLAIYKAPKAAKKKIVKEKSETRGTVYYLA